MIVKYTESEEISIPDYIEIGGFFTDLNNNFSIGIAKPTLTSSDLPEGATEYTRSELITYFNTIIDNQVDVGDGLLIEETTSGETINSWCDEHNEP